jgi:hypothetical protein
MWLFTHSADLVLECARLRLSLLILLLYCMGVCMGTFLRQPNYLYRTPYYTTGCLRHATLYTDTHTA